MIRHLALHIRHKLVPTSESCLEGGGAGIIPPRMGHQGPMPWPLLHITLHWPLSPS